jgi:hypothetical protein
MRLVFRGRYLVGLQLKDDRSRVVCHSRDTTWPVALDDRDRRSARNFTAEVSRAGYVAMLFGDVVRGVGIARGRNWTDDGRLLQRVPSP